MTGEENYDGDFKSLSIDAKETYFTGLYDAYDENMSRYKTKMLVGTGLAAGGVVLAGVSVVLFLLPDQTSSDDVGQAGMMAFQLRPQLSPQGLDGVEFSLSLWY